MSGAKIFGRALGALDLIAAFSAPIEVSVSGPPDCPNASALEDQVQRLARLPADTPHHLQARLLVEPAESERVRLVLTAWLDDGAPGERTFTGASCAEVTDAAALTLALMLNPAAAPADEVAEPPAPTPRRPPVARPAPTPREPSSRPAPRLDVFAGLSGGARSGVLPALSSEVGGAIGVSASALSSWLSVTVTPTQVAHAPASAYGGRLWALNGSWLGCWAALDRANLQLGPCAGVGFTRLAGTGLGIVHPNHSQTSWISGTLGLSASLAVGSRLSFRALALGAVPAARPAFYLQGIGAVHQPAAASAALECVVAVRLF
jgi:hypothetical protein